MVVGIILEGGVQDFRKSVILINIYAPYKETRVFWENVDSSGVLSFPNLIIDGDMNFTLFANEVWGSVSPLDPLDPFLQDNFSRHKACVYLSYKVSTYLEK